MENRERERERKSLKFLQRKGQALVSCAVEEKGGELKGRMGSGPVLDLELRMFNLLLITLFMFFLLFFPFHTIKIKFMYLVITHNIFFLVFFN